MLERLQLTLERVFCNCSEPGTARIPLKKIRAFSHLCSTREIFTVFPLCVHAAKHRKNEGTHHWAHPREYEATRASKCSHEWQQRSWDRTRPAAEENGWL